MTIATKKEILNSAFITSYERDKETDLDYAQARMYASKLGRFTVADPLLNSGRTIEPNSWNRYVYVLNNPLRFSDPQGLYEFDNLDDTQKENFRNNLKQANQRLKNIRKFYGKDSEEYKLAKAGIEAYGCEVGAKGCAEKSGTGPLIRAEAFTDGAAAKTSLINNDTRVLVRIDPTQLTNDTAGGDLKNGTFNLVDEIVHEGVHVSDYNAYLSPAKTKTSDYEFERRGYVAASAMVGEVSSYADVQFKDKSTIPIYNEAWKTANPKSSQVESLRKERNDRIDKVLAVPPSNNGYGFVKSNPTFSYTP